MTGEAVLILSHIQNDSVQVETIRSQEVSAMRQRLGLE